MLVVFQCWFARKPANAKPRLFLWEEFPELREVPLDTFCNHFLFFLLHCWKGGISCLDLFLADPLPPSKHTLSSKYIGHALFICLFKFSAFRLVYFQFVLKNDFPFHFTNLLGFEVPKSQTVDFLHGRGNYPALTSTFSSQHLPRLL